MGILSLGALFVVMKSSSLKQVNAFSLVLVMCIAINASTTVYFSYMKPKKDYMSFAKEALITAGHREVTILGYDENTRGLVSMVFGHTLNVVSSLSDIKKEGLFIWAGIDDVMLSTLKGSTKVNIILEQKIDGRKVRLAYIVPNCGMHKLTPEGCSQ